jgi:1-acyl-sn-glycerol-3-phosphate acyltransferase
VPHAARRREDGVASYNPVVVVLRALLTAWAVLVTAVATVIAGTVGTLVGFVPPRGDWTLRVARAWARVILLSAFSPVRVEGAERVPRGTPVVFMANHESLLDIPVLLSAIPSQVRFLAKKSLFSIPFLGWAISAMGFIPVDRKNRRNAVRSFEEAAERIRRGRAVAIFPEETRTRSSALLPFQRGGFLIAIKAGIPIVPVGLDSPRDRMPRGSYVLRPGPITVRFGAPVPTEGRGVTEKAELMAEVRDQIQQLRGNRDEPPAVAGGGSRAAER